MVQSNTRQYPCIVVHICHCSVNPFLSCCSQSFVSGHPEAHIPIYCSGVEPCLDDSHSAPFNSGGPSTWRFSELPWTSRFYFSCIKPVNQDVWPNMDYDLSIFEEIPCGPVWYENSLTVIQMQSCWHCPTDGEALLSSPEPDDPQDAEAAAGGNAWAQYQFSYLSKSKPHGFGQYLAVNLANFRVGSQLATRTTFSLWKSIVARYQAGSGEELQIQRN